MIVLNCEKLVRIVPAIKFVPHGRITLHSRNRGSISLRAPQENQSIFWLARLMNYGYCRMAHSSWRGDTARRERPARKPETLKNLFGNPAPGEPCRRRRPHARGGPENKGLKAESKEEFILSSLAPALWVSYRCCWGKKLRSIKAGQ